MSRLPKRRSKRDIPAYSGKLMFDVYRGSIRVRRWPRKRGLSKNPAVRRQQDWFKWAARAAKHVPNVDTKLAMEATAKTGLYPRDLIMRALSSGLIDIATTDGRVLTHRGPTLVRVMFQGCQAVQASPTFCPSGSPTPVIWTLPVIDTAGFWSAGQPDRFVIPDGVEIVSLSCGFLSDVAGGVNSQVLIRKNGVTDIAGERTGEVSRGQCAFPSGAEPVVAGDYFQMIVVGGANQSVLAVPSSFLKLSVLQAQ